MILFDHDSDPAYLMGRVCKGLFTAHGLTGTNRNKSTQLHDAFVGHVRHRHN